jgi:Flp pilus assembly protein TadD
MQRCNPLLLCRRPTRIHSGFLPLVPTATVLFCPFEAALPRRTQDAEAICRQILSVEPRHAESLHLLGVFALHAGRHKLAEGMIRQAIVLSPGDSAFHYNFGHALREQGQMDAAIAAYRP